MFGSGNHTSIPRRSALLLMKRYPLLSNWGYRAVLKNSLYYLYNEWKGKSVVIFSYGAHGGGKGAAQLEQVHC